MARSARTKAVNTVFEKWAYANAVLGYKSLIRKLASRVEELEQLGDRPSDFDAV